MIFKETNLKGLFIIEPKVFSDGRGYFFESFNKAVFEKHIKNIDFVQDNESKSGYGVLRGLHFQRPPHAQSKLIRCIEGEVMDVAVDIRKSSETYGRHFSVLLTGDNKKQLFVPKGFAHGFIVISNEATIAYKVDDFYAPDYDSGIIWNDPKLNINWGIPESDIIISQKDKNLGDFSSLISEFE